ncbi:hypothetical protein F4V57_08770 [Acinetobacter qingfengensis]|uniref:glycosyltransferase family 32 protein n=1 Tax=Acinetobacter qingfengensis TaxID=1262585 RepID=UPI0012389E31|nr:glycosyltransferase [Acinetobacter qingfengensis]KAA8733307.1 hypothetical protein F4V57_08770 [Acinetobacter qingfengensis]
MKNISIDHIPKTIHQTYHSTVLPVEIKRIVERLKLKNPDWEYKFYDDNQCSLYILKNYGKEMLNLYNLINPSYGAAKADFFRYLLLYKEGGIYLDIKSSCEIPLSELIKPEDEFFISNWPNENGEFKRAGLKIELRHIPYGEYQQWYIITKPNSPFLKAVIDHVIYNIKHYNPWKHSVAKRGVLKLTGPIVYTLAIHPLRPNFSHRYARSHQIFSLEYTLLKNNSDHIKIMRNHYSLISEPIILPRTNYEIFSYKTFIIFRFCFLFFYYFIYKIFFKNPTNKLTPKEELTALIHNLKNF